MPIEVEVFVLLTFLFVCARLTGKSNHVLYTRLPTSFLGPRNTAHAV